ncbi:hypothetical protein DP939_15685 [Spongiactinospora rosea]|uniref:FAD-binding domain-containing protein n=1 Tax=Spongiactinospora rosea TaxID=2248750 RepID=A0A366M0Q0_9ACTN|nr:FAD-dependent monooxygenase [Spongiactinospora rosea]RBQ19363.1 hypothetical protein DP939_15685 [Spongiactinospora rosea]
MKVIIVGGGIGRLATAVAFHQRGCQVEVLERAAEFTEVGAGLTIQPNGLRALDALGLGERLRAAAVLAVPWLGMVGALLFPGSAAYGPEFAGRTVFVLGLHGQVFMAVVLLLALLAATAATLRRPVDSARRWI